MKCKILGIDDLMGNKQITFQMVLSLITNEGKKNSIAFSKLRPET